MAAERRFTLIGNFTDNITPKLKSINRSLASMEKTLAGFDRLGKKSGLTGNLSRASQEASKLSKSLTHVNNTVSKGLSKSIKGVNKDVESLGKSFERVGKSLEKGLSHQLKKVSAETKKSFRALGDSYEEFILAEGTYKKGLQNFRRYRKEVERLSRSKITGGEVEYEAVAYSGTSRSQRGRGAVQPDLYPIQEGFTIEKGVISGLVVEGITRVMDLVVNASRGAINFIRGAIAERVQDEMSDIKSAGGIFSIGKDKKIAWADSFGEGMQLQKALNAEMASLAAALPGTTNDYVRNMKMVTDTSMKAVATDTQGMIKQIELLKKAGIEGIGEVNDAQSAFVETTKLMSKFSTLAEQGSSGGMPFTQLMEQMISSERVSIQSMKTRFAALRSDPLVSGALQDYEKEMNKYKAGSAERVATMLKALNKAFPPEVIAAMEKSADGIFQAMKSYLFDPDIGWFGLGRIIKMDFSKFGKDKMGELEESMSVFDLGVKLFGAFGQVVGPILAELPKILEVFDPLINPLKEFYVNSLNTISNLNAAKKEYSKLGKSFPAFRASLKAIGQLAVAFGGDKSEYLKLEKTLSGDKINLGAALSQAMKTLFSSEALERVGKAIGQSLGGFLSMLAGLADKGRGLVDESGLMSGFAKGWKESGGSEAIAKIIKDTIGFAVKSFVGLVAEAIKTDPLGMGLVATVFIAPIRSAVINFLKSIAGNINSSLVGARNDIAETGELGGEVSRGSRRGGRRGRYGRGGSIERLNRLRRFRMASTARGLGGVAGDIVSQGYGMAGRPGLGLLRGTRGLARSVGRAGRLIPGGALAAGAIDVGLAVASGENFGKAAAGLFGSVVGSTIGTVFGPVGTLIGGVAGSYLGDKIYDWMAGPSAEQKRAAALQMEAALQQKQLAGIQKSGIDIDAAGGRFLYGSSEELAKRVSFLGLQTNLSVRSFQSLYKLDEEKQKAAQKAADALNGEISRLERLGRPSKEIADRVRGLQTTYDRARAEAQTSLTQLNKQWAKIGGESQKVILNSFKNMPVGQVEKAIADRIRNKLKLQAPVQNFAAYQDYMNEKIRKGGKPVTFDQWNKGARWKGGLGDAISSELKHKPPGSDLVIANSSETIIPAAGGNAGGGMVDFVEAFRSGLAAVARAVDDAGQRTRSLYAQGTNAVTSVLKQNVTVQQTSLTKINQTLVSNQNQTNTRLAKLEAKMTGSGIGLGGGSGGPPIFNAAAARFGLTMTSGYRPGDPGYHGINRARDYSNSTGPTPQMMGFARFLASNYGRNLKELIYTPLGFSIKNGRKVPPYAQSSHYNHVHVAYAFGAGSPAFFSSKEQARTWEKKMAPSNSAIATVTTNSSERFGAQRTLNAPITIYQQPNQDPEELAAIVAMRLSMAIEELENHV